MCGRTACSLNKESICSATAYKDVHSGQYVRCEWLEGTATDDPKQTYEPNFNQTKGHYLPVLVKKSWIDKTCVDSSQRVITSMCWGLRPNWVDSTDQSVQLNPINCRFETMTQKNIFSIPLKSGRRCVVLVDGFYEWKTNEDNSKEPYFVYFPQKYVDLKKGDTDWVKDEEHLYVDNQWKGPRLLTIAGLFNKSADNSMTFTVITVPMDSSLKWLHNRMPAILESEQQINDWLDFNKVPVDEALKLLVPFGRLQYHLVDRSVSNARNNSIENILPIKSKPKQKTIDHWFRPKASNSSKSEKDIKEESVEREGSDANKAKKFKEDN